MWEFLASLTPECSTYDSYILFDGTSSALWYFLCFALGGLFVAMCAKAPVKE